MSYHVLRFKFSMRHVRKDDRQPLRYAGGSDQQRHSFCMKNPQEQPYTFLKVDALSNNLEA